VTRFEGQPARSRRAKLEDLSIAPADESPLFRDAEDAVLAAMMMDRAAIAKVRESLDESAFETVGNRALYRALLTSETPEDPITLCAHLEAHGDLERVGGRDRITELIDVVPTSANIGYHAKIVRDAALRRRGRELSGLLREELATPGAAPAEIIRRYQEALREASILYDLKPAGRIALVDDSELDAITDPGWLWQDVIPRNSLVQIFGDPGTYKSFCALMLAAHTALGMDLHGRRVAPGLVVYVAAEGGFGLKHRMSALKKRLGITGTLGVYFLRGSIALAAGRSELEALLSEIAYRLPAMPVLIIIDTVARNFLGNENDTADTNAFIAGCDRLREVTGASILLIHHAGYSTSDRGRGSSALRGALDVDIQVTRDGERVTLECKKMKDAPEFPALSFEAIPVAPSLVLEPMDQSSGQLDGNRRRCLEALHHRGTPASHSEWMKDAGLEKKRSSFNLARNWLVQRAYVKSVSGTKYSPTDAGVQALGLSVYRQSIASPSLPVNGGPSRGGSIKTPTLDLDQAEGLGREAS